MKDDDDDDHDHVDDDSMRQMYESIIPERICVFAITAKCPIDQLEYNGCTGSIHGHRQARSTHPDTTAWPRIAVSCTRSHSGYRPNSTATPFS